MRPTIVQSDFKVLPDSENCSGPISCSRWVSLPITSRDQIGGRSDIRVRKAVRSVGALDPGAVGCGVYCAQWFECK